jgi:hypothetical protein
MDLSKVVIDVYQRYIPTGGARPATFVWGVLSVCGALL